MIIPTRTAKAFYLVDVTFEAVELGEDLVAEGADLSFVDFVQVVVQVVVVGEDLPALVADGLGRDVPAPVTHHLPF